MSRRPERSASQGSLTRSDRDESPDSPSPGRESPDPSLQYSLAIRDLLNSLHARMLHESGENTPPAEMASMPCHVNPSPSSEAVATTQSIEFESFEVPIMLNDSTYRAVSRPVTSTGPRSIPFPESPSPARFPISESSTTVSSRLLMSPSSAWIRMPDTPRPAPARLAVSPSPARIRISVTLDSGSLEPTDTSPAMTTNTNTIPPERGASFVARFGQPGVSSSPAPWPEDAVPYSAERMLETWLIRQQLLVGIPIDQLQSMTNPDSGRTRRTPPWMIITPEGAHVVDIPPAGFHGVMQPIPRVPWLPKPSTQSGLPAASQTPAARSLAARSLTSPMASEALPISATSALLNVIDSAVQTTQNLMTLLEINQRSATTGSVDPVAAIVINPQAASTTLSAFPASFTDSRRGATEEHVNSPNSSVSSLLPVVLNPTLTVRSISSGSSAARNLRWVRSRAPSPDLPIYSVPGVVGPRVTLRTIPESPAAGHLLGSEIPQPHAPNPAVSSAPLFTILDPRLTASRPQGFSLAPSRDPRPQMKHCRLANVAIFSGQLYAYPPRSRRPRPVPIYRGHRPSRRPVEGSNPDGDVTLQVTRVDPVDPRTINRETPFGGGDGPCAPFPTFDALDDKIGKDEVLPAAEDAKTVEEVTTSQIIWDESSPLADPDSPNLHRKVTWDFKYPPMEPCFLGVLIDNMDLLNSSTFRCSVTNTRQRHRSNSTRLVSVKAAVQSPNEDVPCENTFSLGNSMVGIPEIFALIADELPWPVIDNLAMASTALRKSVGAYMYSKRLQYRKKIFEFRLAETSFSFYELMAVFGGFLGPVKHLRPSEERNGQLSFAPTPKWLEELGRKIGVVNETFCRMREPLTLVFRERKWPERTQIILYKLWDLMKLPDNYYRLWILQNRKLWPDKDICLAMECILDIDTIIKDLYGDTEFADILTTACFTARDMSMVHWFLDGNAPATNDEMNMFLFQ
ncbi:hypothetical protein N7508_002513 [Penicillium antarcticum]|uniref:uncharacterized protein n=1 Tax=Penicillium antarcticum TaxID=416450 RepID=UPI00238DF1D4|nr:uncharacterized protein N7508_002513 [Penicillium antarcticum]KAJ5318005.1 hypothetical protein N7508_002513 [Penicillium antarcticum]